jgi:hypothetical protein
MTETPGLVHPATEPRFLDEGELEDARKGSEELRRQAELSALIEFVPETES